MLLQYFKNTSNSRASSSRLVRIVATLPRLRHVRSETMFLQRP